MRPTVLRFLPAVLALAFAPAFAHASSPTAARGWTDRFATPAFDRDVFCAVRWRGGLVVGGSFTHAGDVSARSLAFWDGLHWRDLGGTDGEVRALAVWHDTLVVGGKFTTAGGVAAPGVARWTGARWLPMGEGLAGGYELGVRAFADYHDALYAVGDFSTSGAEVVPGAARWDGAAWRPLRGGLTGGGGTLAAVALDRLVVAGMFQGADGHPANGLAAWDGANWSAIPWEAPPAFAWNGIQALAGAHGKLYVAGDFARADTVSAVNLAAWDGTSWSALPWPSGSSIPALAAFDDTLFVATSYDGLWTWDGTHASRWFTNLSPTWAYSLLVDGQGAVATGPVAAWGRTPDPLGFGVLVERGDEWKPLQTWASNMHGFAPGSWIYGIVRYHDAIVAAGAINSVADATHWTRAQGLQRWDGTRWSDFPGWPEAYGGALALASSGDTLLACGTFLDPASGTWTRPGYLYDGTQWTPLDTLSLAVLRIARYHGAWIVAGGPVSGNNAECGVYRLDGTHWTRIATLGGGPNNPEVFALAVHDDDLVIGGEFDHVDGVPVTNVAAWNGATWRALGALERGGASPVVLSLLDLDGTLYAGGSFGAGYDGVAQWDGAAWQMRGLAQTPVFALAGFEGALYAARLGAADGQTASLLARWDGGTWTDTAVLTGQVGTLYPDGGDLWAGGAIAAAGGVASAGVALYTTLTPAPPTSLALAPPAPNPARGALDLSYRLPVSGAISLLAFDARGRQVATLDAGERVAGSHTVHWAGTDDDGRRLPAGLYFVRFAGPGGLGASRKVVLLP